MGEEEKEESCCGRALTIINAIAILVGFSWEHAFDTGVEAIASLTARPVETELFLALFVVILIVPAWRKYILKKVMQLKAYHDEAIQGKRMAEKEDTLLPEEQSTSCFLCPTSR